MNREELLGRMFEYRQKHGEEWGQLHVVCSDGNFEDVNVSWVEGHAMEWWEGEPVMIDGVHQIDLEARTIAEELLDRLPEARRELRDEVERYADSIEAGEFIQLTGGTLDIMTVNDEGLFVGHAEAPEGTTDFSHDRVEARFPVGTDPLTAIRETMGVFMERTDGSNAMPWWQRERWWHGSHSGFRKPRPGRSMPGLSSAMRGMVLPPSQTGVVPHLPSSDQEAVYITRNRADALLYAVWHRSPMLYEVIVDTEPVGDDVLPGDLNSFRVPLARIHRIETVSHVELRATIAKILAEPGSSPSV